MNNTLQAQLEMRWLPVVDDRGRTRMEAVWIQTDLVPAVPAVPAVPTTGAHAA